MQKKLEVKDLCVHFRTQGGVLQAVRGVSFDLYEGETLAVVGESGSGKSVTSKAIMGILAKNAVYVGGEILYDGKNLLNLDEREMQKLRGDKLAMIFQDPLSALDPIMRVGDQITEAMLLKNRASRRRKEPVPPLSKTRARERAVQLMEEVGIPDARARFHRYPFEFSGGMRQRIVIAIALSLSPEILICDEPTTALDVTIQAQILELLAKLKRERNLSVIFITHDLGVVANVADRVAVMYAGKIVEYGTAEEIFYDPKHPYTWALLSSMPDLEKTEKLNAIAGSPPNMLRPPAYDAFAERNERALKIDFEREPPFFQVSPTHFAKTWLLHPYAPKVEMPAVLKSRVQRAKRKGRKKE